MEALLLWHILSEFLEVSRETVLFFVSRLLVSKCLAMGFGRFRLSSKCSPTRRVQRRIIRWQVCVMC